MCIAHVSVKVQSGKRNHTSNFEKEFSIRKWSSRYWKTERANKEHWSSMDHRCRTQPSSVPGAGGTPRRGRGYWNIAAPMGAISEGVRGG